MCGIAGIVESPGLRAAQSTIESMTATLRHRGPDAQGVHVDRNVALGHRRLSIIDTSAAANQPMFNEDGTVCVVFNGEIYNYQSLAGELQALGHRFVTHSDTETIVHAWEQYGPKCVDRFRGMFALAIYDARKQQLFLARDRLGKKPLYYARHAGQFAFASEIKALRQLLGPTSDLDAHSLGQYATYGYTVGESTIYPDIRRLEAAHSMLIDTDDRSLSPRIARYWDVAFDADQGPDENEWLERIDHTLSESVRLRLASDVPLGAFLSGGIDSSLIVAYMARHSGQAVRTFTIGFRESSHDESRWAQAVADHLGVTHHVEYVEPDALDVLEHLVDAYDEPYGDESAIPTYYLCRNTRRHVTVALSGDGGDETFFGYHRYRRTRWMDCAGRIATPLGRRLMGTIGTQLPYDNRFRRILQRQANTGFDLYHHAMGYSCDMLDLLHRDVRQQLGAAEETKMARDYQRCRSPWLLDRYGDVDLRNYLPDDILVKVDRASMHHSLEVRCPLLDHELVEMAYRIPTKYKLRWRNGKLLLRKLLRRHLPQELIERPKMGFGVPLNQWFRGELRPLLEEMLHDRTSPMWQWFDRRAVSVRIAAHQTGRANLQAALWRCLFFYAWTTQHQHSAPAKLFPCRQPLHLTS